MENKRNNVIYAEDEPMLREVFQIVFQGRFPNHSLVICRTGRELERALQEAEVDSLKLVFTDDVLGGGKTGSMLTREYSKKPEFEKVPFILSSGTLNEQDARLAGTREFLPKPYHLSELKEVLGKYLG